MWIGKKQSIVSSLLYVNRQKEKQCREWITDKPLSHLCFTWKVKTLPHSSFMWIDKKQPIVSSPFYVNWQKEKHSLLFYVNRQNTKQCLISILGGLTKDKTLCDLQLMSSTKDKKQKSKISSLLCDRQKTEHCFILLWYESTKDKACPYFLWNYKRKNNPHVILGESIKRNNISSLFYVNRQNQNIVSSGLIWYESTRKSDIFSFR